MSAAALVAAGSLASASAAPKSSAPKTVAQSVSWLDAARACAVVDDPAVATAPVTAEGWTTAEAWLAAGNGPRSADAVGKVVEARFGTDTKQKPDATLAKGLIGVTFDHHAHQLVVVTDPALSTSTLASAAQSAVSTVPAASAGVRVQAGCRSSRTLLGVTGALRARTWHPSAAKATYMFSVNAKDSTVRATFSAADRAAGQALAQKFGSAVTVRYGEVGRSDRLTDGEPHWGGAAIGSSSSRFCTAGFTVRRNSDGQRGGVTAGHCFDNGDGVYSGSQYWGTANGEASYPAYDMIRVTSASETYQNRIHVDPCCPSVRTVTSRSNPAVGTSLCQSGYISRALCGLVVTSLTGSLCDDDGCTYGLIETERSSGTASRPGDSGAPVYTRPTSSTASIRGLLIGGGGNVMLAETVANVQSHLGVTVLTS